MSGQMRKGGETEGWWGSPQGKEGDDISCSPPVPVLHGHVGVSRDVGLEAGKQLLS